MKAARAWLAVWIGWTALALFFAVSNSLTYVSMGRPANWTLTLERSLSDWWPWAAATPLVAWLARRFPVHGTGRFRHGAIHVAAGVVVAVLEAMAARAMFALMTGFRVYWLASALALNFVIYAVLVAAAHGVEYYRRSRDREQLETRLAEARLQLLGMQLQPHFLFNTLNTIAEMVHEDPDKADAMIAGLSDLLRRTLELGTVQRIRLDEELELVSHYVDIQKARFGERLQVHVSATDRARMALVPALLLQPLVENAIRHGLAASLDAGRIGIEATTDSDALRVAVIDDGPGVGEESATGAEGVGLGNTRARLEALYGHRCRLDLSRASGRGTRVTVQIPWSAG